MKNQGGTVVPIESLGIADIPGVALLPAQAEELAGGFSSTAYRLGGRVVKVFGKTFDPQAAEGFRGVLQSEHDLIGEYVGDYMPETTFEVVPAASGQERMRVVTVQPHIKGHPNLESFYAASRGAGTAPPTERIRDFVEKSMKMYADTRKVPDVANIQELFSVLVNRNIIVSEDGTPTLVDTNFGRTQRSQLLGPVWHWCIHDGLSDLAV